MRAGLTAAAGVLAAVLLWAGWLSGLPEVGRALSLSALLGAAFGVVLQRSRFCFYCIARDFIQRREASGLYAVLIALAAGTLGYHAVFGAFLPVPGADRLSGRAYRAGERGAGGRGVCVRTGHADLGILHQRALLPHRRGRAGLALRAAGAAVGFALGFASWNTLYLSLIQQAPVIWLPRHLGYGGSALLQCAALAALAWGRAPVAAGRRRARCRRRRPMRGRSRCGCAGPPPQAGWPWPSSP